MLKHYITKYWENGERFAESWIQIEFMGMCHCVAKRRIKI